MQKHLDAVSRSIWRQCAEAPGGCVQKHLEAVCRSIWRQCAEAPGGSVQKHLGAVCRDLLACLSLSTPLSLSPTRAVGACRVKYASPRPCSQSSLGSVNTAQPDRREQRAFWAGQGQLVRARGRLRMSGDREDRKRILVSAELPASMRA
eukprot:4214279-Pleurochrysis_carterae.AAC.2